MKPNFITTLAMATAMLTAASCNDIVDYAYGYTPLDETANTGAPVITAVYDVTDTTLAIPLTEGQAGQMVHIVGKNLNNAQRITFNTMEADLTEAYTFSTGANVKIPSELAREGDGKIVYTTDKGSCEYNFTIPYPELLVDGLECEFMNAGDSVTLTGQNFNYYDFGNASQVVLDNKPLGVGSITNTSMKVLVPEGTADNSTLQVTWTDGTTGEARTAMLPFRPTKNLLYGDMSDVSVEVQNLQYAKETDADITSGASSLGNPHIHITGAWPAWNWGQITFSSNLIDIDGQDIGLLDRKSLKDYVLKFEAMTSSNYPLPGNLNMNTGFNWGEDYAWHPGGGEGLNTLGTWRTITLPLYDLVSQGFYASSDSRWTTLKMVMQPVADMDADLRLGNFRIEKK